MNKKLILTGFVKASVNNILLKTLHIERERLLQNCAKTRKGITKNPTQHLSLRRSSEPVRTPGYTLLLRLCIKFEFQSNRLTKPQDFTAVYEIWGPDKAPRNLALTPIEFRPMKSA